MLKVVLCDGDSIYIELAEETIMRIASQDNYDMKIVIKTSSPREVLEYSSKTADISLYVIEAVYGMEGIDGIELAKAIRERDRESYIVYSTARTDYIFRAVTGLIRPAGFLVKKAGAREEFIEDMVNVIGDVYRDYLNAAGSDRDFINVNVGAEIHRISLDQIVYLEAFQKKVYMHTSNQRIGFYDSLSSLEKQLGGRFLRCHKSFIINVDKAESISFSNMRIGMCNGAEVDISRSYKETVRKRMERSFYDG